MRNSRGNLAQVVAQKQDARCDDLEARKKKSWRIGELVSGPRAVRFGKALVCASGFRLRALDEPLGLTAVV